MKTRFTLIPLFIFCFSLSVLSQTDADKYWILENFSSFDNTGGWIDSEAEYETYPNDVKITTLSANVEPSEGCSSQTSENLFRIRGLARDGYLEFTVPNASTVKIYVSGKSTNEDRTVYIYRNGELVEQYDKLDRTKCRSFVDKVNTQEPVTYKVTAGDMDSSDPITVFYIEVLKYGEIDVNEEDKRTYWIKEDFLQFETSGWIVEETSYQSYPNNLDITTVYANVEVPGDCTMANSLGNQMRIGGLMDRNGSLQFTVPDAALVKIHITGKSSAEDRVVRIYRNNILIKTYEGLDQNTCRIFTDYVFSPDPVTYKVTAGIEDSDAPVVVYYIEAIKYEIDVEDPKQDEFYEDYWIYEDFSDYPLETGYWTGFYEAFPQDIKMNVEFANPEAGDDCTANSTILRLAGRVGETGSIEFTVPDYGEIAIGLTGKSTVQNRTALVYIDDKLYKTISELDRTKCEVFSISEPADKETKVKIVNGNLEGPVALRYIHVKTYASMLSIEKPDLSPVSIYPNPVADVVFFRSNSGNPIQKVAVVDLSGRQILSETGVSQMNVNDLPKGMYILKLQTEEGVFSHKLIKK